MRCSVLGVMRYWPVSMKEKLYVVLQEVGVVVPKYMLEFYDGDRITNYIENSRTITMALELLGLHRKYTCTLHKYEPK